MHQGRIVFAQLIQHLPRHEFNRCVARYRGNQGIRQFSCYDQFIAMAFAQLTGHDSLRDTITGLHAMNKKLYHAGFRAQPARRTLAEANEKRDWRIYADFAKVLIKTAQSLYAQDDFGIELTQAAYALDSTTIDLCLAVFPWAHFRQHKAAIKLHTLLDLKGNLPVSITVTTGKVHDVNLLDQMLFEPGSIYLFDRGYLDFLRLYRIHQGNAFFITRTKKNTRLHRLYSHSFDPSTRSAQRSNRSLGDRKLQARLSGKTAPRPFSRFRNRKPIDIPDQQFPFACRSHCPVISEKMAGRTVLQVDQTALAHPGIFRNYGKCRQNSNLDRHQCLRAGSYRPQTAESRSQSLHNSTGFKYYAF